MRSAKPQRFNVSGKKLTGNEKFPGNIYLKPEESPLFLANQVNIQTDAHSLFVHKSMTRLSQHRYHILYIKLKMPICKINLVVM